jgi:biopolymer transport protein ExbD
MAASTSAYADEGDEAMITDINVTPLVDVVLVLLIVFMITVPTIVALDALKERELNVQLPQASEAKPLIAKPKGIVVNIDVEGNYTVSGRRVSDAELFQLLQQAETDNPGRTSVIIRADRNSRWQRVGTAMNMCNRAHIRDYHPAFE